MNYCDRLHAAMDAAGGPIVVGIDPVLERLPADLQPANPQSGDQCAAALAAFGRGIIEAVRGIAPAVKINIAFFEVFQAAGVAAFYDLVESAHENGLLVIADIKRGDIGSTASLYARGHFGGAELNTHGAARIPDAVTLAGYLGRSAVQPFVDMAAETGRGVYILVRPSDPEADLVHEFGQEGRRFYQHMADLVSAWGGAHRGTGWSPVGAVVAAKDAASTAALRAAMPHTPWLVPGYGAQGGTADACRACFTADGRGAVVNASRSVIYAFADQPGDWQASVRAAAERFSQDIRGVLGQQAGR